MQTFVVKNGVVQNVIEINGMSREEYERLEQCQLCLLYTSRCV